MEGDKGVEARENRGREREGSRRTGGGGGEAGSEINKAIVCCLLLGIIRSKTLI